MNAHRRAPLVLAALGLLPAARAQSSFHVAPDLPGGADYVDLRGVSADGSTAVGTSLGATPGFAAFECITWTLAHGTVGHGDIPGGTYGSRGAAIDEHGALPVGRSSALGGEHAHRNMVDLGSLGGTGGFEHSEALAISADGARVVGFSLGPFGWEATLWCAGAAPLGLGDLPGGGFESYATAISGDGNVIVGTSDMGAGLEAWRLDLAQGGSLVSLGELPGGTHFSHATCCSHDGSVVWGESDGGQGATQAFRWTASTGLVAIGTGDTRALACNADGTIAVGRRDSDTQAILWDELHGERPLDYVLRHEYGLGADIDGWDLFEATGISADGTVIVGNGYDPRGMLRGWLVRLERPTYWNFCFADGQGPGDGCPCGNHIIPGEESGCLHSFGVGAKLRASGTPSIGADTLLLSGSDMPSSSLAYYYQGNALVEQGWGAPFGNGLRCAGGAVVRLGARMNSGGASAVPGGVGPRISVRGGALPGATLYYQCFYTDTATYCTSATFNYTNGVAVTWSP